MPSLKELPLILYDTNRLVNVSIFMEVHLQKEWNVVYGKDVTRNVLK